MDGTVKIDFLHKPKSNLHIEEVLRSSLSRLEEVPKSSSSRLSKDKIPARHSFVGSTTMEGLK
jgi:hypothetical protein